ncbi:flagellar basal body-associated FliL family protein [Rhodoflexus caldus]|uniref:hypothetical protein n=1 Tax=Rhodoflexus caldus TaxID=2891236 RepID=UPI00202A9C4E|nr:hypothetical protein [Rhodoflexus caldus]
MSRFALPVRNGQAIEAGSIRSHFHQPIGEEYLVMTKAQMLTHYQQILNYMGDVFEGNRSERFPLVIQTQDIERCLDVLCDRYEHYTNCRIVVEPTVIAGGQAINPFNASVPVGAEGIAFFVRLQGILVSTNERPSITGGSMQTIDGAGFIYAGINVRQSTRELVQNILMKLRPYQRHTSTQVVINPSTPISSTAGSAGTAGNTTINEEEIRRQLAASLAAEQERARQQAERMRLEAAAAEAAAQAERQRLAIIAEENERRRIEEEQRRLRDAATQIQQQAQQTYQAQLQAQRAAQEQQARQQLQQQATIAAMQRAVQEEQARIQALLNPATANRNVQIQTMPGNPNLLNQLPAGLKPEQSNTVAEATPEILDRDTFSNARNEGAGEGSSSGIKTPIWKKWWFWLVIVLLLAAIGGGAWFWYKKKKAGGKAGKGKEVKTQNTDKK